MNVALAVLIALSGSADSAPRQRLKRASGASAQEVESFTSATSTIAPLQWLQRPSSTSVILYSVAWNGASYVVGAGGYARALTSLDGEVWTIRSLSNMYPSDVVFSNGRWVSAGGSTWAIYSSPDGNTWTVSEKDASGSPTANALAYGNGITVCVGGSGRIKRSVDGGLTWQFAASPVSSPIYSVTFAADNFLAVSDGRVLRSADGLTWSLEAPETGGQALPESSIVYGSGMFVAVGEGKVAYSKDSGRTWIVTTLQQNAVFTSIGYHNGRFVIVGRYGVMYESMDGISWQNSTSGVTVDLNDVTYGGGKWVVCGANGVILTASEGENGQLVPDIALKPAVMLEWQTRVGAYYQVQASEDLQTWRDIGPKLVGDGNLRRFSDERSTIQRFYRVQVR